MNQHKKLKYYITIILVSLMVTYITYSYYNVMTLENIKCIEREYNSSLGKINDSEINKKYYFSNIFTCADWDKVIFVGMYGNRLSILLRTGVLLPNLNYDGLADGTILLFFVKHNQVKSVPIKMYNQNLIFSKNYNSNGFLILDKEEAIFQLKKLPNDRFDLLTLDILNPSNKD